MSAIAATFNRPIYDRSNHSKGVQSMATQTTDNELRPELAKVVEDILGLKALATTTGFATFKSQKQILEKLSEGLFNHREMVDLSWLVLNCLLTAFVLS